MIIDYSSTGQSVVNVAASIQQWLSNHDHNPDIMTIAIGDTAPWLSVSDDLGFVNIPITDQDFWHYFFDGYFNEVAPSIHFNVMSPPSCSEITQSKRYQTIQYANFKKYIASILQRCPDRHNLTPHCKPDNTYRDDDRDDDNDGPDQGCWAGIRDFWGVQSR
ncbi:MAG: hypothetical protein ACI8VC_002614 [Candidatus Endobugula sp.]